jgi:hypothetical protein
VRYNFVNFPDEWLDMLGFGPVESNYKATSHIDSTEVSMATATSSTRRLDVIQKQIDALQKELEVLKARPVEPPTGSIVRFDKRFGGSNRYSYVGLRTHAGWFMSGTRNHVHTWDELLDFVIESEGQGANWNDVFYALPGDLRPVSKLAKAGARLVHPAAMSQL